ncbi:uncharacterized protein LAJ45_07030 [Morchella importuna]|uniref:uncharacterized protein n=1 Tax=Morchella importuna TaxID=1174673 RepID=UPI001E8D01D4|nr:uncharacterized protein LAJ45_07030 [Morchella importuna]KAH8149054.1 hypothetical protein LAJ45_07030 [Morchella importuna]
MDGCLVQCTSVENRVTILCATWSAGICAMLCLLYPPRPPLSIANTLRSLSLELSIILCYNEGSVDIIDAKSHRPQYF